MLVRLVGDLVRRRRYAVRPPAVERLLRGCRHALVLAPFALLTLPAAASANGITVNSTADTTANDGACTLREAITSANTNAASGAMANECAAGGTSDTIGFSSSFNGELADMIAVTGSELPKVTTDVDINGGQCITAAGVNGPCVGVSGPSGMFGLTVDNVDNTSISGVAATGALTGLRAINSASGFSATNDWLGVKLDGTAGANNTGLFLDPDSNGATIGGTTAAARNVFANNNNVGLDIEGADNTTVQGNYFGVGPDGTTQPAGVQPVNIEITGTNNGGGFDATGNLVGGTLSSGEASTPACDGPCNVIAGATAFGVDLRGNLAAQSETPAGQTTIRGNHVGFKADGVGELPNTPVGIGIGAADQVTVGGPSALDANHVTGGKDSIQSVDAEGDYAEDQLIQNNIVGLNYAGTAVALSPVPGGSHGILVFTRADASATNATVTGNRVAGGMDDPIEAVGSGAVISQNLIGIGTGGESLLGGITGIDIVSWTNPSGNLVTGNLVQNSIVNGVELQGADYVTITGNTVTDSGEAGIRLRLLGGPPTQVSDNNVVGGDSPGEENLIVDSGGDAIEIVDGGEGNVIARNTGSGNADLFIDLGGDGLGNSLSGPNLGIQAPVVTSAQAGSASGTAQPGANVRVFSKATSANGEIGGFLGSAVADGSGSWQVTYSGTVAGATPVGVTQTASGIGTSEMAVATTANTPSLAGGDTDPPQTKIKKGPKKRSHKTRAKFRFGSDELGSTFKCKLDRRRFRPCRSPKTYRHLKPGKHTFKVKATDAAGNTDPTPARRKFTVLPPG